MSRALGTPARRVAGFPRVSGDEPETADAVHDATQFSPRERG